MRGQPLSRHQSPVLQEKVTLDPSATSACGAAAPPPERLSKTPKFKFFLFLFRLSRRSRPIIPHRPHSLTFSRPTAFPNDTLVQDSSWKGAPPFTKKLGRNRMHAFETASWSSSGSRFLTLSSDTSRHPPWLEKFPPSQEVSSRRHFLPKKEESHDPARSLRALESAPPTMETFRGTIPGASRTSSVLLASTSVDTWVISLTFFCVRIAPDSSAMAHLLSRKRPLSDTGHEPRTLNPWHDLIGYTKIPLNASSPVVVEVVVPFAPPVRSLDSGSCLSRKQPRRNSRNESASSNVDMYPKDIRTAPVGFPFMTSLSSQQLCPLSKLSLVSSGVRPRKPEHAPGLQWHPVRSTIPRASPSVSTFL
mmetsp:Transcript_2541/g.7011  ORF Transcript_2541/g.7011 Transcript_2541/m.7011 type:complete len:363 (-) Transcript_2541:1274-2362(-)